MFKNLLLTLLALGYQTASATSLLEAFGSGENAFVMEFVTIGNPGNAADTGVNSWGNPYRAGSVAHTYNIGMYEVSRNMITSANTAGGLGITMADMTNYGGNGGNQPATGVNWIQAAIFVNWMNTSTGGTAAYKFSGSTFRPWSPTDAGYNEKNMLRNSLAKYVLPSNDEWFKAAYGNLDGTWNDYPNGGNSDNPPYSVASGTAANTAVFWQSVYTGPADIYNAGSLSPYGTMAQGGNVFEWTETVPLVDPDNFVIRDVEDRTFRGGFWNSSLESTDLAATTRYIADTQYPSVSLGFRVAMVPEPSALSLLAIGLSGLALVRRRKQS
jgi:formylglycine-generating enzyme required for sulfatase activity